MIEVLVKPGSKKGPLVEVIDAGLVVYLREKAHDGEANEALIRLLAKHFDVAKSQIEIVRGQKSHRKVVKIGEGLKS